ncbi:hypothetical protein KY328_00790 [Candidatus Woesearchaeota archaeon]|nr:hypothetical protein [Candidatus Woesearchaeota archaeon]MBW3021433.1 hypothetical protein [Candidatus Woesearchaeota archaeon]
MDETRETMPIYVKIDEYRDVLDIMNMIKSKLNEARKILGKINDLKNEEDAELELWHTGLDEVERKVEFVDKTLFEPEAL